MITVQIDEFLENYMLVIEKIQKGETCLLMQDNRPLAELFPVSNSQKKWKRKINPIRLSEAISMTQYIRQERNSE